MVKTGRVVVSDGERRIIGGAAILFAAHPGQGALLVGGDVVALVALDLVLRRLLRGVMAMALVVEVADVDRDDTPGDVARFRVPGDVVAFCELCHLPPQRDQSRAGRVRRGRNPPPWMVGGLRCANPPDDTRGQSFGCRVGLRLV